MFQDANSFPRSKLDENSELRGTDDDQGQISEHIFTLNGGYYVYYPSNIYRNMKIGKYHSGTRQLYLWIFSHVTRLDQSLVNENIWGTKNCMSYLWRAHKTHQVMIIDDYPFSHGDQKSYPGMKRNSLEFSLEFILNHSHTLMILLLRYIRGFSDHVCSALNLSINIKKPLVTRKLFLPRLAPNIHCN